jgi:hypothetical protein
MNTVRCTVAALAITLLLAPTAIAQSADYQPPRAADGKPDLQGFWSNVSLTSLERPGNFKSLVIAPEEADRIEKARAAANKRAGEPTDPNSGAPRAGQDVGGYNNFYVDAGTHYGKINGALPGSSIRRTEKFRTTRKAARRSRRACTSCATRSTDRNRARWLSAAWSASARPAARR